LKWRRGKRKRRWRKREGRITATKVVMSAD
jgi:hypothetical protein